MTKTSRRKSASGRRKRARTQSPKISQKGKIRLEGGRGRKKLVEPLHYARNLSLLLFLCFSLPLPIAASPAPLEDSSFRLICIHFKVSGEETAEGSPEKRQQWRSASFHLLKKTQIIHTFNSVEFLLSTDYSVFLCDSGFSPTVFACEREN